MLLRPIPSTGETIPVIGLGTWQTFDVGTTGAERTPLRDVLQTFWDLGGTVVDSSPMYGRAEQVVGDLANVLGLRDKLFVATKVWTSGAAAGVRQMEDSERKLRRQVIDLMQVHNLLDVDLHLETLAGWKAEGRVRYVGVTHYTSVGHEPLVRVLRTRELDFVQVNYSVAEREAEGTVLAAAQERGVAVLVNRPFAEGRLLARLATRPLPAFAAELACESWSELLLKFVLSHPAVTCVIPATSSVEHLRANMRAGAGPLPTPELRQRIVDAAMQA